MDDLGEQYQNAGESCQPAGLSLVDRLVAQLVPWRCVLCRGPAAGMDLCIDCLNDLPWQGTACRRCALPLAMAGTCGPCQRDARLDFCLAALNYDWPVPQLVTGLKYRRITAHARVLAELMAIRLREAVSDCELRLPDLILPVPMHPYRQLRRHFNQAELIALQVGRELGLPVAPQMLWRTRYSRSQTGQNRAARRRNVRHAFGAGHEVCGKDVAVVDDVMTTGSTLMAVASALRARGARSVQGWVAARA